MSKKPVTPPPMRKSVLLKLKIKSLLAKYFPLQQIKQTLSSALSLAMLLGSIGYLAVKAPELHGLFLRAKVGSKVYMIKANPKSGGGTGFAVKALRTGQTYIVTNSHVCEHTVAPDGTVLVQGPDNTLRRRVIEISDRSDLCLIEDMPGVTGLSLGNEPHMGSMVDVVGHPRLRPLSLARGEIVGLTDVTIVAYILPTGDPTLDDLLKGAGMAVQDGKCDSPKNLKKEVEINAFFTMVDKLTVCFNVTKNAYLSTAVIYSGNSGSPTVDFWGNVVGVAFASDDTNYGDIVSLNDLTDFLAKY